ncbi:hypothetical protein HpMS107_14420 [Helicobacter pylori]
MAAQVFPGECGTVQVQHVEIGGGRIPKIVGSISHEATIPADGNVATDIEMQDYSLIGNLSFRRAKLVVIKSD